MRHHQNDLEFLKLWFGTRRTVVQIHSPRPTLLELTTYNTRRSERPQGAAPGARWYKSVRPDHSFPFRINLRTPERQRDGHLYKDKLALARCPSTRERMSYTSRICAQ